MDKLNSTILMAAFAMTAALALAAPPQQTYDKAEAALKAAYEKETVDGDLKSAIALYEKLARGANRPVAAKALIRIGHCQEKLGSAEARKAYERVVKDFADQPSAVEARARLAALAGSGLTPKLLYSDSTVHSPRLNRDGSFVAAFCANALCLFETATGTRSTVVPPPDDRRSRHWRPLPSPDGQSLAYVHFSNRGGDTFAELRIRRRGQSADTVLVSGLKDTFSPADWTADGKTLLFAKIDAARTAGLFLIPATGGTAKAVHAPDFDWSAGRDNCRMSPDGKWLAYAVSKRSRQGGGYVPTDVAVISLSGGEPHIVLDGAGHERVVGWLSSGELVATSDRNGKVLPYKLRVTNGQRTGDPQLMERDLGDAQIAGVAMSNGALFLSASVRETELHAFSPDLKSSKRFTTGYQAKSPVFSPDGKKLAYASGSGTNSIVIRDLSTGAERRLPAEIPRVLSLGWYPNSRDVFAIVNGGDWENRPAFRFDTQTAEMKPLPNVTGMYAFWSPAILGDGRTLIYTGREKAASGDVDVIIALDTDSGERRTFVRADGPYTGIGTLSLSRDRRRIAYVQYNRASQQSALTVAELPGLQSKVVQACNKPDCSPLVPFFTPDQKSILYWSGPPNAPVEASLALLSIGSADPAILKKHPFTPDGPAFHPVTGEVILGTYTQVSELRIK